MDVTLGRLRLFVWIAGPLVPLSYVIGIARAPEPEALWGGIVGAERLAVVPFMFLAAAGFLTFAYHVLYRLDQDQLASLRWPWGQQDGRGLQRLLAAYALYLIPSALWLEATLLHLERGQVWTQVLTIAVLTLVSIGILMLGLLSWSARRDGVPGAPWMLAAVVAMGIQSILNDNIIWVWKFPWGGAG
ncbi:MAG: hypothetical protein ACPGQL_02670 [Thermoplasmatota archaeon]